MVAETSNGWLNATREALYKKWVSTTGHRPGATNGTWACEIARGCRTCDEHLSLPCTLLHEANEIGLFLSNTCFSNEPSSFVRLYFILLFEFTSQLSDVASLLRISVGKTPRDLSIWTNRWAKHRLHLLVQHHPQMIYADEHGDEWEEIEPQLEDAEAEDRCGKRRPTMLIDTSWLATNAVGGQPKFDLANGEAKAIIVVPKLAGFLDETCTYFRRFIDEALKVPDFVRMFQSEHANIRC